MFKKFEDREWNILIVALFAILTGVIIKNAWIGDDGYITFRTIDNFVNHFGLRWNVLERVQSYTHPLWMMLLTLPYYFIRNIYYDTIVVSIILTIASVYLIYRKSSISRLSFITVMALMILSKSFIDYTTSGLETPLTIFLLILLTIVYFKDREDKNRLFLTTFLSALIFVNRQDLILLALPVLITVFYQTKNWKNSQKIKTLLLGLSPAILWELFSLFYYGFLFPNTAYAKLNTGIDWFSSLKQGIFYYLTITDLDLLTILVITISLYLVFANKLKQYYPFAIGMLLYMAYILKIGGDFMGGRFLVPVFFLAIIILSQIKLPKMTPFYVTMGLILFVGLFNPKQPLLSNVFYGSDTSQIFRGSGLADERGAYYQENGLLKIGRMENGRFKSEGIDKALEAKKARQKIVQYGSIGIYGYYVGPDVYVLDYLALADPLLARLPVDKETKMNWRIGHFERAIPCGYQDTIVTGKNKICDPDLALYYDKLSIITQGKLISWQRFKTIIAMNIGRYNYLIERYDERVGN